MRFPAEDAGRGRTVEQGAARVTLEADAVTDGHGSGEPPGHDEARLGSGDVGRAQRDTGETLAIGEAAGHANRVLRMF
jgi:hypothetical protein